MGSLLKIVAAPVNLKEAPSAGYPAKGVVSQKCTLYFHGGVEKLRQSVGRLLVGQASACLVLI